ncbi:MAG: CAP domain-containing protein [Pirellulales bacterium]
MNALTLTAGFLMLAVPGDDASAQVVANETASSAVERADDLHAVELAVVEKTNRERARYGLRPLRLDRRLLHSARRHCAWMCNTGAFQHTTAPVAENIAMGQNSSEEAMRSWMNSSGHRANILNAGYSRIGVSAYRGNNGRVYWVQQFLR